MDFNRKELQEIYDRANEQAGFQGKNTTWLNAYLRLRDAADNLDAMRARSDSKVVESSEL